MKITAAIIKLNPLTRDNNLSPGSKVKQTFKAALLFWLISDFRCGLLLFIVLLVIHKYRNR